MGDVPSRTGGSYLGPGFVIALCVRLLTAALVIVIPLYAVTSLGVATSAAGVYVLLLWAGNAVGVAAAVLLVRSQSYSTAVGFGLVALAMGALAALGGAYAPLFMLLAGAGVGFPQPFLSAFMHLDSVKDKPFSGLGLYSSALGVGLILGPLVALGSYLLSGFSGVFLGLSLVCVAGLVAGAAGHGTVSRRAPPPRPDPKAWKASMKNVVFRRAIIVNFLYSLILPVFLSFGAIFAEKSFAFTSPDALLLYSVIFAVSVSLRLAAVKFEGRLDRLLMAAAVALLVSTLTIGFAQSWAVFVVGMLVFALPHAYIFPVSNFYALASSPQDVMNASYVFQASSAAAEFITPAAAVLLIPSWGVQGVFVVAAVLAAATLFFALGTMQSSGSQGPVAANVYK
jgi:hypothetical protein